MLDQESATIVRVATRDRINVKLTTEEIRDRAMLLPKLIGDLDAAEAEAKAVQKDYKKKIDKTEAELRSMKAVVDSGEEFREVECERVFDISKGITWLEFKGHKYLQRAATEKELEIVRQGNIFDEDNVSEPKDDVGGESAESEAEDSDAF